MTESSELIESINCMARLLTAVKDCFVQERAVKDEIINIGSEVLLADLRELRQMRENGKREETT